MSIEISGGETGKIYVFNFPMDVGVKGTWRGSTFVLDGLDTGPHKFSGYDEAMLALSNEPSPSLQPRPYCGCIETHPTRGGPVNAEQYGSRRNGQ